MPQLIPTGAIRTGWVEGVVSVGVWVAMLIRAGSGELVCVLASFTVHAVWVEIATSAWSAVVVVVDDEWDAPNH